MDKIQIINQFYNLVGIDSGKARNEIFKLPYKKDSYLLSCLALTYKDEAMFFKNGKMRKVFLKDKLKLAQKYIDKAFLINPDCRDMLYTKGEIYNALGDTFTAIDCYIKILESENDMSIKYNCSNSELSFVQMLLNDSRFQLYRLFYDLENYKLSKKFLVEYKKYIKKGVSSIYNPLEDYLMYPPLVLV